MHNQPQSQRTSYMYKTSGDPSLTGTSGTYQAQQGSRTIYQPNQVRYEDSSQQMTRQPESQEIVRQYRQNYPSEPNMLLSHDEIQQYGWTENRSLSYSRTERQDRHGDSQDWHQWQGIDGTHEQNWTENRPLTTTRR